MKNIYSINILILLSRKNILENLVVIQPSKNSVCMEPNYLYSYL